MSALLKNVTNCIWHAFDSLQSNDFVHKSKLKVCDLDVFLFDWLNATQNCLRVGNKIAEYDRRKLYLHFNTYAVKTILNSMCE